MQRMTESVQIPHHGEKVAILDKQVGNTLDIQTCN